MSDENLLTIDKQALKDAFAEAIRKEATAVIKEATVGQDIGRTIRDAFAKKWESDRDNWLEQSVRQAMRDALWSSVQDAIKEAGVENMIKAAVVEHINTPEFAAAIKQRAIEAVKGTTFCVKPEEKA